MPIQASVTLNPQHFIGDVHKHLYGANLEHIGRSVYGGHWAEMLVSRKFAGPDRMFTGYSEGLGYQHPSFGIVAPWEAVNPDYARVLFVHDNTTFYAGTQSQRITIRQPDDLPHGICQRGLHIAAAQAYELRVVLKGEGQPVYIELAEQAWTIPAVASEWTTYTCSLTPTTANPDGALSIMVRDKGNLWIGAASLMPAGHVNGHRPDVIAALREWTPAFLRWPGGNFVSAYHWLDGIGPRDQRPGYLDPAWNAWETNDVGTDEFIDLCRRVGSEPAITVNAGNGTVEQAAAWVEYCNGDASTEYGALRAANGHPEPYHVKTWFVGNEQFGNWQVGHCDAETYAQRYLDYAAAMRAVDPDLLLIAVGVPIDHYGHWNELVLRHAAHAIDELSVHYYSVRTERWEPSPSTKTRYLPRVAAAHEVCHMLDQTLDIVAAHSDPPVPLAFDEWNTFTAGKPPDFFEDYGIADALYVGAVMNACLRRCDRIKMSATFNLINVMGNYRVTPAKIWKIPSTLVLELMTHHRGDKGISCQVSTPTMSSSALGNLPAFEDLPVVDAAATYDRATQTIYLSVVNREPEQHAALAITGINRSGNAPVYIVAGDSPFALNTEDDVDAVVIETTEWGADEDILILQPHSFSLIIIPVSA